MLVNRQKELKRLEEKYLKSILGLPFSMDDGA